MTPVSHPIRLYRIAKGLTLLGFCEVAESVGVIVTPSFVSMVERGKRRMGRTESKIIAALISPAIPCSFDTLLDWPVERRTTQAAA
jgi:transcriptional regulator with XRE-family HTH domain